MCEGLGAGLSVEVRMFGIMVWGPIHVAHIHYTTGWGGACLQHGTSPLMWAAVSDDIDVAKTLINHKARINARNKVSDGSVYMVWLPGEFAMSIV